MHEPRLLVVLFTFIIRIFPLLCIYRRTERFGFVTMGGEMVPAATDR